MDRFFQQEKFSEDYWYAKIVLLRKLVNGNKGFLRYTDEKVKLALSDPYSHEIWSDLKSYTDLNDSELMKRLRREQQDRFEFDYEYHRPESSRELAMFYRYSIAYLWANSMYPAIDHNALNITAPIVQYLIIPEV